MLDLVIVIPVYNEEGAIRKVLTSWAATLERLGMRFQIHAFNDGSTDDTASILRTLESEIPNLVAHNKTNSGHGPTCAHAYRQLAGEAEWVFQVDSDDEMGSDWFYKLWNIRSDHDFIVARRFDRESSLARRLVTLIARLTVNLLYGACVYDVNVPYRLMNSAKFRPCFASIPENTFAPNVLISGYAAYHEFKTVEIHIPHRSRYSGEVSIRSWKLLRESVRAHLQTIKYRWAAMPTVR
jgi:glycosyltransferase involved in cell wall biosynthesis